MDTIHVATVFADTRGYLSPEEPRDFVKSKLLAEPSSSGTGPHWT
jgi:hypothetical protein